MLRGVFKKEGNFLEYVQKLKRFLSKKTSIISQRKELLRLSQNTKSKGVKENQRLEQSREIVQKIRHHPCWNESESLLGFMPMKDEPDIFPLASGYSGVRGKNLYLPQYQSESKTYSPVLIRDLKYDLIPGKFGILEPNPQMLNREYVTHGLDLNTGFGV